MEPSTTPDYTGENAVKIAPKSNLLMICDPLCRPSSVSKILAAVLFVILPFIGAYVGYQLAGERVVDVHKEWNLPEPQPQFSQEEINQLRSIQAENKAKELSQKIEQANVKSMMAQATSTVIFKDLYKEQPCVVEIPQEKYSYGSAYGSFILAEHTRSCFGDNIMNTFKFSGTTTIQGALVTDVMDGPFLEISDKEYLAKMPSRDNGINEVDLMAEYTIYQKLYAPELESLFSEAEKNKGKTYQVEVIISGLEFNIGAPKGGFRVNTQVLGEPKIVILKDTI